MRQALKVSSDVYFYMLGLEADGEGGDLIQEWAKKLGLGETTGIDLPGEAGGPGADAGVAQRALPARPDRPPLVGRRQRSTSRSARATCRRTRCSWRSPTRRSPTAATSSARTSASASRTPRAGVIQEVEPGAASAGRDRSRRPRTRSWRACDAAAMEPGGTSYAVFGGFPSTSPARPVPPSAAPIEDQSWYVGGGALPEPGDRRRADDRAGRLRRRRRGARGRAHPRGLLRT